MKAFEKWKKENVRGIIDTGYNVGLEDGWKAALEWVLKTNKELDTIEADIDMPDIILEELKE